MDFSFNDDQLALRDAVRRFCDGEYPAHRRGDAETSAEAAQRHAAMVELGLLGLPFDARHGGSEQGPVEVMLVAHELGRALVQGTWLPNVVMAGPLLQTAGTAVQQSAWLEPMVQGRLKLALACHETEGRDDAGHVDATAKRQGDNWVLDGAKSLVLGGDVADVLLVLARADHGGCTVFAVDAQTPGLKVQPFTLLDGRGAAHVTLGGVKVSADRLVGPVGGALPLVQQALSRANAALCAEMAGALEVLLDLTCEHLRNRRQFGAPLAKFQSLQHAVADMAIALEQVKSMACVAAAAQDAATEAERDRLVAAAKTLCAQLSRRSALAGIQLHGAMGMTDECRAAHYAKRLVTAGQLFGGAQHHLPRFNQASAALSS